LDRKEAMTETVNIILVLFILVSGVAAVRVRELVSGVFLAGCFSFFVAVLWALLMAADVSFTEALAGAGVSSIFFLLSLFGSSHLIKKQFFGRKEGLVLGLVVLVGLLFWWGSLDLPLLGEINAPAHQHVSPYYLQHSLEHSHTPNAVTAVVVDYRGFDTLIEAAVIFTAGVACLLIIKDKA
jgi:multicomponent Na+:H+ antiporter subunit B